MAKSGGVDFRKSNFPFGRPQLKWTNLSLSKKLWEENKITLSNGLRKSWGDSNIEEGFPVPFVEVVMCNVQFKDNTAIA